MKKIDAQLTPHEEVSDIQLASFKRHKRNGTSPGNPKWYRPSVIRAFVPQLSVRVANVGTGQEWHTAHSMSRPDPFSLLRGIDATQAYVEAYETAMGLKRVAAVIAPRSQRVRRAA